VERINLVPDDVAFTGWDRLLALVDRRMGWVIGWVAAFVFLVEAGMATAHGFTAARYARMAEDMEKRRVSLVAEMENVSAFVSQLERSERDLTQQTESLKKRIEYLGVYRETPGEWADTLEDIRRALPYGVWLTEMETLTRWQLRLDGGAFNDQLVSQFMSQLKANPRFIHVEFRFAKLGKIGQTGIVEFEVACQLAPVKGY